MLLNRLPFAVLAILFFLQASAWGQAMDDSVKSVDQLYRRGLFNDAELAALRYLNRSNEFTDKQKAELHRVLAFISIARDDRNSGKDHFLKALRLNPEMDLDRTLTSPKIYSVFDQAKTTFENMREEEIHPSSVDVLFYRLRIEAARRSLLLPGWGQFHKGDKIRGYLFSGLTTGSAVGLAVLQVMVTRKGNDYHSSDQPENAAELYDEYRDLWVARNCMGTAVIAFWTAGVIDALLVPPKLKESTNVSVGSGPPGSLGVGLKINF